MTYDWQNPPPSTWEEHEAFDPELRKTKEHSKEQPPDGGIFIGKNALGRSIWITPESLRTHMHVVGATNVGKSFFLEGIIKNLILQGHGVCLIDPHGSLYDRVLDFCTSAHAACPELALDTRVIPFNIAEKGHILGFNPIQRNARNKVYQVVALMEVVRKCWGQDNFQATPRLARWLYNTIYAVIDSGMTFLQAYNMVNPQPDDPYRKAIVTRIKDPKIQREWEYLARIKSDERREDKLESCLGRLRPFVSHDTIRHIVGQHTNTLSFPDVLAGQKVFLVNLAGQNTISQDDRNLLGTMLVNDLLTAAFARPEGQRPPYYLFIDEFQHFVTKDICEILDGGRKFGLHLILAHQHLNQLKQKDAEVYYSTLTNARTKVIFGGLIAEDLDVVSKELFVGELDPNKVKDEIWQTKFRPVETTRLIVTESESDSQSSSHAEISHISLVEGSNYIAGSGLWAGSAGDTGMPDAVSISLSSGSGSATNQSSSSSRSRSATEVPFYEQHEFSEMSSRTFQSLEEQLYIKQAQMKRQPTQHAAILIPGHHVEFVKTPTLEDFPVPHAVKEEFKQACFRSAGYFKSPEEAEQEVRVLEQSLLVGDGVPIYPTACDSDEQFMVG